MPCVHPQSPARLTSAGITLRADAEDVQGKLALVGTLAKVQAAANEDNHVSKEQEIQKGYSSPNRSTSCAAHGDKSGLRAASAKYPERAGHSSDGQNLPGADSASVPNCPLRFALGITCSSVLSAVPDDLERGSKCVITTRPVVNSVRKRAESEPQSKEPYCDTVYLQNALLSSKSSES
ncbi:hypothetical protein DV515_00007141 [Chloebia gouldiae]|uniref:Uncharacterized protein n=1 Tax=Chloebia gouldiae TaxID=44316 RepID=A0A3L8SI95_CHLGU|nr:hypothetical protein DV515_00007141 [Chloebia gouldiae]